MPNIHRAEVVTYVVARCNARRASDRYNHALAYEESRKAQRAYACANRAAWPALTVAKDFLDTRADLNCGHTALALMGAY